MSAHSPGPWSVKSIGGWTGVVEENHPTPPICKLVLNNDSNANLIAAAPDLLIACKSALLLLKDEQEEGMHYEEHVELLTSAIKRAEGGAS